MSDIFLGTLICHIRKPNYLSGHWLTTGKRISKILSFQAKAKVQIKLPTNQSTLQFQPLFAKRSFKSLLPCFTALFFFQQKGQYQGVITCPLWRGSSACNDCWVSPCLHVLFHPQPHREGIKRVIQREVTEYSLCLE